MATIIGSVVWAPQSPNAGDSVKVDVCDPTGKPYANQQTAYIAIDGVAGSSQYMQFPFGGARTLVVSAVGTDGTCESQTVTITVGDAVVSPETLAALAEPANAGMSQDEVAWVKATQDVHILTVAPLAPHDSPYNVGINFSAVSGYIVPPTALLQKFAIKPAVTAAITSAAAGAAPAKTPQIALNKGPIEVTSVTATGQTGTTPVVNPVPTPLAVTYTWDFGDGSPKVTSNTTSTAHDFESALDTVNEFRQFDVTVTVTQGSSTKSWTRTLSVHNPYVACKKRGYVVPKVTATGWATKVGTNFVGKAEITNLEPVPMTLVSRQIIPMLSDTTAKIVPTALQALDTPIVVPAKSSVTVQVSAPFSDVPLDALGFSVVFTEQSLKAPAAPVVAPTGDLPPVRLMVTTSLSAITPDIAAKSILNTGVIAGLTGEATNPIAGLKIRASVHFLVPPQYLGNTPPLVGSIPVASLLGNQTALNEVLGNTKLTIDATKFERVVAPVAAPTAVATPLVAKSITVPTAIHLTTTPLKGGTVAAGVANVGAGTPIIPISTDLGPAPDPIPPNEVMPPVAVGNQCDPDNLPENIPENFVCQITPQTQSIGTWARFLNARKGDVILCPSVSTGSLVDQLFTVLTPVQQYGHSGIMTRNYEQITHCTASEERLLQYAVGGILASNDEGLDPDAIKYAWPGTITQTVDHAVNGEMIADPSSTSGQQYSFQEFNSTPSAIYLANNQFVIIPPMVLKPDPVLETDAVRTLLNKVADSAYAGTGKYHYRFYAFTNPAGIPAAPSSGLSSSSTWAEGTNGAVCSAYIWLMMKAEGVDAYGTSQYATEAELSDYAKNTLQVQLDPGGKTPDGLIYYSIAQRTIGANWLYGKVHDLAKEQAGWAGNFLTGAADYYADQLVNCFAVDDSSTPDENIGHTQPWLDIVAANAVSPQNIMAWNGPDHGGNCVLGYSEPLIYLPNSFATVPIYKWVKVTQYGSISGKVTIKGKPAVDATVYIPGTEETTGTKSDGSYSFSKIAYGNVVIKAQLPWTTGPDGSTALPSGTPVFAVGQVQVDVKAAQTNAPVIELKPPDEPYNRTIAVTGYCSLDCSEWSAFSNGHTTGFFNVSGEAFVGIGTTYAVWNQTETSKDATATFSAVLVYEPDESVTITLTVSLDEPGGASVTYTANVAAGDSHTFVIGNSNSWLNGHNGFNYNGFPDVEAKNDTLLCSLKFTNNEWAG